MGHSFQRPNIGSSIALLTLTVILFSLSAHSASFDCAKASEPAEKFVCANKAISKLDDELGTEYRDALNKANPVQKKRLIKEQKHWLTHTRNECTTEACFKLAYWSRLAGVETFFEPKSPLYKKESDKAPAIQKVLTTSPLFESVFSDPPLCRQIMADLKEMNGIHFIEPIVQTQSYEDPALDPWERQCNSEHPLNYSAECDPNIWPVPEKHLLDECAAGFGLPPFKVFELSSTKNSVEKRYIFYSDSSYGPMNEDWRKPSFGGGYQGFYQFTFSKCDDIANRTFAVSQGTIHDGPNYNSIIEYKKHYYFLMLYNLYKSYWLDVRPIGVSKACTWGPVKRSSKQETK